MFTNEIHNPINTYFKGFESEIVIDAQSEMCFRTEQLMAITLNKFLIQGFLCLNRTAMKKLHFGFKTFKEILIKWQGHQAEQKF